MRVYLQNANGGEIELTVNEPDPADGTFVVQLGDGSEWIRICPEPNDTKRTD